MVLTARHKGSSRLAPSRACAAHVGDELRDRSPCGAEIFRDHAHTFPFQYIVIVLPHRYSALLICYRA